MKTDRELLELAALGYGFELGVWDSKNKCWWSRDGMDTFDSLQDDGDALRLAARLNINISYRENRHGAWVVAEHAEIQHCAESLDGPHEYDATRRAITRAAAQMQLNKEQNA